MSLLGNPSGLNHWLRLAPINLYCCRALPRVDKEFSGGAVDVADKGIGRHKFSVHHISPMLAAKEPERGVGDVLHWSEQQRALS